ncbi:MAG: hypothetical protein DRO87_11770 [Candidatus Thorarchaeota archaeon]|nr:MAG: hypothetical protein DRO87_11770 [Candidatus Thorarchaeota archaeon]
MPEIVMKQSDYKMPPMSSPITDVQKVAINGLIEDNKVIYSIIVKKALNIKDNKDVPTLDDLTFGQALSIIRYINVNE